MSKKFKLRIYYEDTDAGGVVYYANYLKFLERARTKILLDNNFNHTIIKKKYKIIIVVKSCNIDFIKPAILDDDLTILTSIIKKSKIQIYLNQTIYRNKELILNAEVRLVSLNEKFIMCRMPSNLYEVF